jgi:hypothetical protein
MARFIDSPGLFGIGIGTSTECEIRCEFCKKLYNKGETHEMPASGNTVGYTVFADKTVCACCFEKIEFAIWDQRETIIEWLRAIVVLQRADLDKLGLDNTRSKIFK